MEICVIFFIPLLQNVENAAILGLQPSNFSLNRASLGSQVADFGIKAIEVSLACLKVELMAAHRLNHRADSEFKVNHVVFYSVETIVTHHQLLPNFVYYSKEV
jgi:hypothetical protein